jgi:signal transduction histidine kinase
MPIEQSPRRDRHIAVKRELRSRDRVGRTDVQEFKNAARERTCSPSECHWALAGEVDSQTVGTDFNDAMLLGREAERRRVAQELHDDISQKLSLVALEVDEAERLLRTAGARETAQKLRAIRGRVGSIAQDIHRIAHNLYPAALVQLGLLPALRMLCRDFSDQLHIGIDFTSTTALPLMARDVAVALYRMTQECLTNVARHSRSRHAQVALMDSCGVLQLTISDGGVGFDADEPASTAGLGLVSIRERAQRIGGDVQITSARGHGTTVTVRVPLDVATGTQQNPDEVALNVEFPR